MTDQFESGYGGSAPRDIGATGPERPESEAPRGVAAVFGPFFNAILAPSQTWGALDAKPALSGWIALWIAVFTTVLAVINWPITQQVMAQSMRAQMRAGGQEMSAEQLRRMTDTMTFYGSIAAYASGLFMLLAIAFIALLLWVLAAVMGGKGASYGRAFGVTAAAGVIHPTLYSIYVGIILQLNPPEIRRIEDVSTMTPTLGLDLLLAGPDTAAWLEVLYQRIDLFNLWWALLVVGGSMAVLKLEKGQAIIAAFLIWLLFTVFSMGGAVLRSLAAS